MMTHDELMALPENGGFDWEEKPDPERPGKVVKIPHMRPAFAMSFRRDDQMIIWDKDGAAWHVGWIDGIKHRSRAGFMIDKMRARR